MINWLKALSSESKKRFYDTLDKHEKEKHDVEVQSSHHQARINI